MSESIKTKSFVGETTKGSVVATFLSVLFVLAFALVMRIFGIGATMIPAINLVIKILSVFIAVFVAIKTPQSGFLKGALIAVGFVLLSDLLFLLLGGQSVFADVFKDLAICVIAGVIAGIIAVNRKKL
ncbi:MAG: TIGR04086 family membrane protein [Clostridia bacterium]|nr:TIGR04086 family membrane protein [Clostridia bacterium]